jgi:hypothetical protein
VERFKAPNGPYIIILKMTFQTEFENHLPLEIREKSVNTGNEYAIPYPEVLEAVQIAAARNIAILGVETFAVVENGLQCERFSVYEFELGVDWASFVKANNERAMKEIAEADRHAATRFILTTSSKSEFEELDSAQFRAQLGLEVDECK